MEKYNSLSKKILNQHISQNKERLKSFSRSSYLKCQENFLGNETRLLVSQPLLQAKSSSKMNTRQTSCLEEDVVEIMAEVRHSFAERYDMEFEPMGGVRDHIRLLDPSYPKIVPCQLVGMLKSTTGQEVLGRLGVQERVMGRRVLFLWLLCMAVVERGNWRIVQQYAQEPGKL